MLGSSSVEQVERIIEDLGELSTVWFLGENRHDLHSPCAKVPRIAKITEMVQLSSSIMLR